MLIKSHPSMQLKVNDLPIRSQFKVALLLWGLYGYFIMTFLSSLSFPFTALFVI